MYKVFLLADINSGHTQKWATGLAQRGFQVALFSLSASREAWYSEYTNITVFNAISFHPHKFYARAIAKLGYLKTLHYLRTAVRQFCPHIIHAHYASSYGLLGSLLNIHPYVISAWGSDVLEFPKKSLLNRLILKYNFRKADCLLSTSHYLAGEMAGYTRKRVTIVPFGVDTELFKPTEPVAEPAGNELIIGTVKSLEKKYGIDYLICAFKIVKDRHPLLPLKLLIVGDGPLREQLLELARRLCISEYVMFTGNVSVQKVPAYQNMLSVYVSLSVNESFGVSAIEAAACQKPVVVSAVGGLKEVVVNNGTGFVVPSQNSLAAAEAIEHLVLNASLRKNMGEAGQRRAKQLYEWSSCLDQLISVYQPYLAEFNT